MGACNSRPETGAMGGGGERRGGGGGGLNVKNPGAGAAASPSSPVDEVYEQALSDDPEIQYCCKLLMLGDSGVGKSSLMIRFADDSFSETYSSTIGIDFKIRTVEVKGKTLKVQIWDTAGQERFRTITRSYYKGIHGYILVYDITSQKSFEHVSHWLNEIDENGLQDIQKMLVGNKSDLNHLREVETQDGQEFAQEHKIPFMETSAKSSENVREAIEALLSTFVDEMAKYEKRRKK